MICQKLRSYPAFFNRLRTLNIFDCHVKSRNKEHSTFVFSNPTIRYNLQPRNSRQLIIMAGPTSSKHTNRLSDEKSPYLLQHAHNPVDWYPWGQEAFVKAQKENKLIFLSVGYSTCHWCHVMERESFENEEIAKIMNDNFVCVKVDREERPDVDKLYMTYVQVISGSGGWPMSVWLTPNLETVFGGTYFPPNDEGGRPGFKTVLQIVAKQWRDNRQMFSESGQKMMELLRESSALDNDAVDSDSASPPGSSSWEKCYSQLSKSFEPRFGGFGEAPKFPQPVNLDFLFHLYAREPKSDSGKRALEMCAFTLRKMAMGGIHDHVAHGFARYSTDHKWHVPHFEKMLYDQGQLAVAYSNAFLATKDPFFADIIDDILTYVNRDLSHKSGGFFSAEDADSLPTSEAKAKKEGAFCVWSFDEIENALSVKVTEKPGVTYSDVFSSHFEVQPEGNVNPMMDPHNELKDKNVLIMFGSNEKTAQKFELPVARVEQILRESKEILYKIRSMRPRPHLDDKMLTAWNGLMISGFAKGGQALNNATHVQRAIGAAKFIHEHLYNDQTTELLRSCYRGQDGAVTQIGTPINGFLDDYAFLIRGLLDLYESCFDPSWIEWAEKLQETQDRLFWDEGGAGYFTSPAGDPSIVIRMKEDQDGAEPSGNSVSVLNLLRLSTMLDKPEWKDRAARILSAFKSRLTKVPLAVPEMVSALMLYHDGPTQIFITGLKENPDTATLINVVQSRLLPGRIVALVDDNEENILYKKCGIAKRMKPVNGRSAAYVCRNHICSLPVTSSEELVKLLDRTEIIIPKTLESDVLRASDTRETVL